MKFIQFYFCIFLSSAMLLLKHCNYLNILSIPAFCVSVKALWTNLGKLSLFVPKTHLESLDYKAIVSTKGRFTNRIQLAADMIVYRSFVLCVLVIIYSVLTFHLYYSFLS